MTKIALIHGGIAGVIIILAMIIGFALSDGEPSNLSMWTGYLIMIIALSLVFVGVKRHRDRNHGGVIKFLPAFLMGLAIAFVAGTAYVATWEIYLAATGYEFMDKYVASVIAKKEAAGLAGAALDAEIAKMNELAANYANPLFRMPMTFLEIFPVGLIVALVSAALLRNPKLLPARA